MPTSWTELNSFYLILAVIGIPLLLGFLTEAGKDLYNKITKKPGTSEFLSHCKDSRDACQKEITGMHTLDNYMLDRQNRLREDRLPAIETQLKLMIEKQETTNKILEEVKQKLDK
jgi:hypothetical protein